MMDTLKTVAAYCKEQKLLPESGTVLVGLSGGADSMCLLHILLSIGENMGFSVAAAHFNHNLRGEESDGDERFVTDYCRDRGIPVYVGSGDVLSAAKENGLSVEEAARELRYDFFSETAEKTGAVCIATAHSADDNLETLLLRLARGTGLHGLGGIPPRRGKIIRPILCLTRNEIETYLTENSIPHREDSSNQSDDYSRNRLRHHAVPALRDVNPAVARTVSDTVSLLRRDEEYLSSLADKFIEEHFRTDRVSVSALCEAPYPITSRAIRKICGEGLAMGHVEAILSLARSDDPSGKISIPGRTVHREYDMLCFGAADTLTFKPVHPVPGMTVHIPELGLTVFCEDTVCPDAIHKSLTSFLFKTGNICGKITLRPRMTGDRIQLGPNSGKSLKKLFIEKKIPAHLRDSIPIIADDAGPLAVYSIGSDVRARPAYGDPVISINIKETDKDDGKGH